MLIVGIILIVAGVAYLVSPWVRKKVAGFKTYFMGVMIAISPMLDAIDPHLLGTALNLDDRWKAAIVIALGIGVLWAHRQSKAAK